MKINISSAEIRRLKSAATDLLVFISNIEKAVEEKKHMEPSKPVKAKGVKTKDAKIPSHYAQLAKKGELPVKRGRGRPRKNPISET
jgi:uncharacterized short protein YbdD (DUF466 family)